MAAPPEMPMDMGMMPEEQLPQEELPITQGV
jgi:hypothetical protein